MYTVHSSDWSGEAGEAGLDGEAGPAEGLGHVVAGEVGGGGHADYTVVTAASRSEWGEKVRPATARLSLPSNSSSSSDIPGSPRTLQPLPTLLHCPDWLCRPGRLSGI